MYNIIYYMSTNPTLIQDYLSDVDYPVTKSVLLDTARRNGAPSDIMRKLEQLPDQGYDSPIDVSEQFRESY